MKHDEDEDIEGNRNQNETLTTSQPIVESERNAARGECRIKIEDETHNDSNPIEPCSSKFSGDSEIDAMQSKFRSKNTLRSVPSICCRICHCGEEAERLISPCLCCGTMAFVHKSCLEYWLNISGTIHCELCKYQFPTKVCLRYGFWKSLLLWYQHPNNRDLFQADFLICFLLTVVTFGIAAVSLIGIHMLQVNSRFTVSRIWTHGPMIVFLALVVCAYIVNLVIMLKSQLVPWYRWWVSARQVKLVYSDVRKTRSRCRIKARKKRKNPISNTEVEIETINI